MRGSKSQDGVLISILALLFVCLCIHGSDGGLCLPFCKRGKGSFRLLLDSPAYGVKKYAYCWPYIHKATNDDIKKNRYIFLDLFSKSHHNAIKKVSLQDDPDNGRTDIISFEIDHTKLPIMFQNATIGDVWYYSQLLQGFRDYVSRTVMTYNDDQGRFCVIIESFDASGARLSMRIYRKRKRMWWLKKVAEENLTVGGNILNVFSWFKSKPTEVVKQTLNIEASNCPLGMINHRSSCYDLIYNSTPGKDTNTIGDILFRTMPEHLSEDTTDVFIWRYFVKDERETITYVVIAEVFQQYIFLKYYKCLSPKDKTYEIVDSFAAHGSYVVPSEAEYPDSDMPGEIIHMVLKHGKTLEHIFDDDLYIIVYPETHHYIVRPLSTSTILITTFAKLEGEKGKVELNIPGANGYTFVTFTDMHDATKKKMSLTSIGSRGLDVACGVLPLTATAAPEKTTADQHTVSILMHQLPLYYMGLPPTAVSCHKQPIAFYLDDYLDTEVLTTKVNSSTTFYTPNLYGATVFDRCIFGNKVVLPLRKSYNTQVMYMKHEGKSYALVFQAGATEIGVHEIQDDTIKTYEGSERVDFLKDHKMLEYEQRTSKQTMVEPTDITLNFKDPMISRNIETMVISANVVLYMPATNNTRISRVIWGNEELVFNPDSSPTIVIITNPQVHYMLVDDWNAENNTIGRYLYAMEQRPTPKLRIIAHSTAVYEPGSVRSVRESLQETWYDLIPEKLPILCDYTDTRVSNAKYEYHELIFLYMPIWHAFALGNVKIGNWVVESIEGHRWRQVHRTGFAHGAPEHVYTMIPHGITEQIGHASSDEFTATLTPYERLSYPELENNSIPLLVDGFSPKDVSSMVATIGPLTVTTLKPANRGNIFNPVVFGQHEIQLFSGYKCTNVIVSQAESGLREINLDVNTPTGTHVVLTFAQSGWSGGKGNNNSELYELRGTDHEQVQFVDLNEPIYSYESYFDNLHVMDFNSGTFPHYIRYLTLNPRTMYFTGYGLPDGLKISYGQHDVEIPSMRSSYHIWVLYPHEDVKLSTMYLRYGSGEQTVTQYFTVEDPTKAAGLQRPKDGNCNWGPMSNMEFYVVNSMIARRAMVEHELEEVDLDLSSGKRDSRILRVKVDGNTLLYTTLATFNCVIGRVEYKGVIIRGIPKQVVKHVYHSHNGDDEVLLVLTQTVRGLVAKAYRFTGNNAFESVDHSTLDASMHPFVHNVLMALA